MWVENFYKKILMSKFPGFESRHVWYIINLPKQKNRRIKFVRNQNPVTKALLNENISTYNNVSSAIPYKNEMIKNCLISSI